MYMKGVRQDKAAESCWKTWLLSATHAGYRAIVPDFFNGKFVKSEEHTRHEVMQFIQSNPISGAFTLCFLCPLLNAAGVSLQVCRTANLIYEFCWTHSACRENAAL